MAATINGKRVALLVTDGFEQIELTAPKTALDAAGARTAIVSPKDDVARGWKHTEWGDEFPVDVSAKDADADEFDALVLPGGVMNPDKLRRDEYVQKFVQTFFEQHKPVAAICHGPWTLIDAGVIGGRRMTSYHSIQTDLKNAGASWIDEEVVIDSGLITSRHPDDLEAFNAALIEKVAEGPQAPKRRTTAET